MSHFEKLKLLNEILFMLNYFNLCFLARDILMYCRTFVPS